MMILTRYITKTVLSSTLMVLLVLIAIYTFMDFVNELDDLGEGSYQLAEIFSYLMFSMPKRMYDLLPIAALIGSVLGLGALASQGELVAMRAAGMSVQKINKAVALVALYLALLTLFIGEVVRPPAEQKAQAIKSVSQTGTVEMRSEHGFWTRDGRHFNHISRILPDGRFEDISIYEFDSKNRLRIITTATEASYEGEKWALTNVVQSTINEKGVKVRSIKRARWSSPLNPGIANIVIMKPEFLPAWDLVSYISYLEENNQAVEPYKMAFWMKVMMPVSAAVMVFLAVPFVFGPLRTSPIGGRILIGSLVGIGFHLFNQSFQNVGLVFGVYPWLSAVIPTAIFGMAAWYMMRKIY